MAPRRRTFGWIALVLGLAGCGDEAAGPPAPGSVAGSVTTLDHVPVVGAGVLLVDPTSIATVSPLARTAADGSYRIEGVTPGTYSAFLFDTDSLVSFWRTGATVDVAARRTTTHDILLMDSDFFGRPPVRATIAGRVTDDATGAPIAGALVAVQLAAYQDLVAQFAGIAAPYWTATDANGRFALRGTRLDFGTGYGLVPIVVTKTGYEPFDLVGRGATWSGIGPLLPDPAPGESLQVQIRLRRPTAGGPTGVLRGRVLYAGSAVAGVRVGLSVSSLAAPDTIPGSLKASRGHDILTPLPDRVGVTDTQGRFQIPGLRPGAYDVRPAYPRGDGYAEWRPAEVEIAEAETTEVELLVARTLAPTRPQPGENLPFGNVELEWEPAELPPGYSLVQYLVSYGLDYPLDQEVLAGEPRVTIGPFAAGSHVRWSVRAEAYLQGSGMRALATFEDIASFSTVVPSDLRSAAHGGAR